jgi:hypothetical protein
MVEVDICKSQHHHFYCESGGLEPPAPPATRPARAVKFRTLLKIL